jgi:hypothetical protein
MPCRRCVLALLALSALSARADDAPTPLPVVAAFEFENDGLAGWTFTDPKAWRIADESGNHVLEQFQASDYKPTVRSPFNIALAPGVQVGDFDLTLRVRSTARDYPHRDVCLIFNHQDPSHFYYVHLGKAADPHAHSIFLVNGEPRVSIAEKRTDGTPWTEGWHTVKLTRRTADGLIAVYFDDMKTPIMTTHDQTFLSGRIGVGTFDDTARFDSIEIRGLPAPQ